MNSVNYDGEKCFPSKIVCVGLNYINHIKEVDHSLPTEPVLFIKPNSSISSTLESQNYDGFHYEGEISFIVKDSGIAGIGFGFDVTKRNLQNELISKSLPWERSKAFDASAVFTDFISFNCEFDDISMILMKNDVIVQEGAVTSMLFKPEHLLENIKQSFSLEDYDILMTGTPSGIGNFITGDVFTCKICCKNDVLINKQYIVE